MSVKKSDYELDERAAEARFILNNPLFVEAIVNLRQTYLQNLIGAEIASEEAMVLHAKMVVLEELVAQIGSAITDQKMTRQGKPSYGN